LEVGDQVAPLGDYLTLVVERSPEAPATDA
jgi:hypothetical protein